MRQLFPMPQGIDMNGVDLASEGEVYLFRVNVQGSLRWFSLVDWTAADNTASWLKRQGYDVEVYALAHEPADDDAIEAILR